MPESASNISKKLSNILLSAHGTYEQKKIRLKNKDNVTTPTDDSNDNRKKRLIPQVRKVNKVVQVRRGRTCPNHPGQKLTPTQVEASQTIFDLKFTSRGVKKQITQYIGKKGFCIECNKLFSPPQIRNLGHGKKYGHGFMAWVNYHRLAMRLPFKRIIQLIEDTFEEQVAAATIESEAD